MDLARPSGVVFDETLDAGALKPKLRQQFDEADVYLKGVADDVPLRVHYTAPPTSIPERFRKPIRPDKIERQSETMTLKAGRARGTGYWLQPLEAEPTDRDKIRLRVSFPRYRNNKRVGAQYGIVWWDDFAYQHDGVRPELRINWGALIQRLRSEGVPLSANFTVEVRYPIEPPEEQGADGSPDDDDDDIPF
jgi:hypothetical protein